MTTVPALEDRLKLARQIQEALEPPRAFRIGPLEVATSLEVCTELGGDLLCFRASTRWIGVLIGDVMGKGVAAALAAAYLEGLYDELARTRSPAEVVEVINLRFCQRFEGRLFATLLCAQLDLGRRRWVVARAGHPPGVLLRADGGYLTLEPPGLPIGVEEEEVYSEHVVPLVSGDELLLVTDGIWEGGDPAPLVAAARAHRQPSLQASLRGWLNGMSEQPDAPYAPDDRTAAWLRSNL